MASSGWQGEKTLYSWGKCSSLAFNLRVDSISHSGGTVYVSGVLRFVYHNSCGGTGYYNYTMSATPSGGSTVSYGTWSSKGDGYYQDKSFSGSFSAPTSATSGNFNVTWSSTSGNSGTATWGLSFDSSTTAPSGGYITYNSSTHESITATTGVSNWGSGYSYRRVQSIIVLGSSANDFTTIDSSNWTQKGRLVYEATVSTMSLQQTMRQDNYTADYNGPMDLKGMRHYMLAYWNYTNVGNTHALDTTVRYMPPAPSQFSYTDPGDTGSKTYPVTFVGDTVNNNTSYDTASLTRTIRYKIDNGSWIYVDNETVALLDYVTSFNVTVPAGSVATIEGWMTYHGQNSETATVVITNSNVPKARIYGSVNNASKKLAPLYGTFGNYFDGRHYLERSNASVDILGDQITITKTSSGSGGYTWVPFLVDATDEIVNKQVTLSGELLTSGNFTSGVRLWWMNSANTGILSGPVAGIEYIGNSGKFLVSGIIPARPSGAGKLALLLYSNIASTAQGAFTVFNNIKLTANTKNMFNYLNYNASTGGITTTLAADGTFTMTGKPTSSWVQIVPYRDITGILIDGAKYRLSASNSTNKVYVEVRGTKVGGGYSYYGTSNAFTVDKSAHSAYQIHVVTNTTTTWSDTQTITSTYQLEMGETATSFAPYVDTKAHKILRLYASKDGRSKLIYDDAYQ